MSHSQSRKSLDRPGIHVICLGAGGGPSEDNVTGFLVRSIASDWTQKGTVLAVDAGSHLAAIVGILSKDFPLVAKTSTSQPGQPLVSSDPNASSPTDTTDTNEDSDRSERADTPESTVLTSGPFAGVAFPHLSSRANALHFVREHVDAYLITHPHLDHVSGFAINTAAFHNTSRPKRLAALPFTVNAIKQHIFNDIIWPNLTDEDDGVGLVSFQRLTEGGNAALGEGSSRGFIEVCNGLAVKGFRISHGNCASAPRPSHSGERRGSAANLLPSQTPHTPHQGHHSQPATHLPHHASLQHQRSGHTPIPSGLRIQDLPLSDNNGRRQSNYSQASQPGTPTIYASQAEYVQNVVDSTAYFIRADQSAREILIFGDVEPDAISASPRNHIVWSEAAPKIVSGLLRGIFIECSYTDAQKDQVLFGHLAPRHLVAELQVLADMVIERRREHAEKSANRKRKRTSHLQTGEGSPTFRRVKTISTPEDSMSDVPEEATAGPGHTTIEASLESKLRHEGPLSGLKIVIIHVKDGMADGPLVGDLILEELRDYEDTLRAQSRSLGCTFEISRSGDSYTF